MTMGWLPLSGLGLAGMVFAGRREKRVAARKAALWIGGAIVLTLVLLFSVGCGGGSSSQMNAANHPNHVTMMVPGTSGSIVHSTPVTLTIQ